MARFNELLALAAARAGNRPFYLAGALAGFQRLRKMTDDELQRHLDCSAETLNALRLCRRPDVESPQFQDDARTIGERLGIAPVALAQLLREVAAVDAMRGRQGGQSSGFLMAARDKPPRRKPRTRKDDRS